MVSLSYKEILPVSYLMEKTERLVQHEEKNFRTRPRIWGKYLQNTFFQPFLNTLIQTSLSGSVVD